MKKLIILLAAISLQASMSYAQDTSFDNEIDSELQQVAPNNKGTTQQAAPNSQPIYILNQATPTSTSTATVAQSQPVSQGAVQGAAQETATQATNAQQQVQKQPQVDVIAAPLTKSRAEKIREARQQAEVDTENKVAEKIELSRMEDEKKRAAQLFGEQQAVQQTQVTTTVVAPVQTQQQAVVAAPVVVEPVKEEKVDRGTIREELRAALDAEKSALEEKPSIEKHYFGVGLGIGDYPDATNVRGNYILNAAFGTKYDDTYAVEGQFNYGDYTVDRSWSGMWYGMWVPQMVDVHQYSGAVAVKYFFLDGMIKPTVGGLAQYSYRTFSWSSNPYSYGGYGANNTASSHAVDLGATIGADIEFKKKWTLGLDFKYLFNVASRWNGNSNSNFLWQGGEFGTPIEKLQYYTLALSAKVNF